MVLPSWLEPLPDAAQQRALDGWAIDDLGIPGLTLMERAGYGLAARFTELVPDGQIAVVCGGGNNGGDGLVAARLLRERGRHVRVLMLGDAAALKGDAKTNLDLLPGPPPQPFDADELDGVAGIIDAILGTGFAGVPREPAAVAIAAINSARRTGPAGPVVLSCDVPSGVDASTGEANGEAVQADASVTFHAAKPGLWITPGKDLAGTLTVIDIGIPVGDRQPPVVPSIGLMTDAVIREIPRRTSGANKFTAGSVLVCGGSRGLTGAVVLASTAAARAGAGYVTVAVPDSLVEVMQVKLLEVMSVGLTEADGALTQDAVDVALERASRANSVVIGPGLGRAASAQDFARRLALGVEAPLVLDADGLNAHAVSGGLEQLSDRRAPTVLTPHAGELGRLLGLTSAEINARRLSHARDAATRSGAIVVLKGDDTIVVDPAGRVAVSPGGAPMLATAGTGDVLSGILGAFLSKGMEPFAAACAAVLVHIRAGQAAALQVGADGVIAGDVVHALPRAISGSPA
jgi:ADP-dependent NAD(P)H-hydrate dehydratase / NAD(P)H-hydrate epimerase